MELRICIDVDDMDRAIAFYTGGLGLRVGRRFESGFVELLGAGSPLDLLLNAAGTQPFAGTISPRSYQRHWTPVHLDFVVSDIEQAAARCQAAGAKVEEAIAEKPWGRIAIFSDPFGHGFCLLEFRGRGYDELLDPQS